MQTNILFTVTNISRNILRCYARRSSLKRKTENPGIQKRLNILHEQDDSNLENIDVEELESDFMSVGEMHREHENELKQFQEKEKYWIVRRKYFKEDKINFLTWNDKEQIRYLHNSNPNEWTVERLAEGFPAFPETITKIIKGKWQIKNETKKVNHDKTVEKNWNFLKQGKYSQILPENLINHVLKFSSRKQNLNYKEDKNLIENTTEPIKIKCNEFSSIINNYAKQNKHETNLTQTDENPKLINENFVKSNVYGNKHITLDVLKETENFKSNTKNEDNLNPNIYRKKTEKINDDLALKNISEIDVVKHKTSSVAVAKTNPNIVQYPEKISIPKDKYKKGLTYKVNDCYYDDDGEFLYRVPGMM